ncbi:MAG: grasp-with-spasm system ATP-grasp peptide maturase [Bacteroidota bacterium]
MKEERNLILLFCNQYDSVIHEVRSWVQHFGKECVFLKANRDFVQIEEINLNNDINEIRLSVRDRSFTINEINSIWYRGGLIEVKDYYYEPSSILKRVDFKDHLNYYLTAHSQSKLAILQYAFKNIKTLGENAVGGFNKVTAMINAKKAGLSIPDTIVTGQRKRLQAFSKLKSVIIKNLDVVFDYTDEISKDWYMAYTAPLNDEQICELPDFFGLTLCEEKIEKLFEIRVFYLAGKCYAMAILSQSNTKTELDYRKYDRAKMNRVMAYNLPKDVIEKVGCFMTLCNLNTGSIDFIMNKNLEYIFLEVNPVGQFGNLSDECNYNLSREIAQYLVN